MPKSRDVKGEFILFQFKIYGDEIERWKRIRWRAKERGLAKRVDVDDSLIRRALFEMKGVPEWLVTDEERNYFRGLIGVPETLKDVIIAIDGALESEITDIRPATPEEVRRAHPEPKKVRKGKGK